MLDGVLTLISGARVGFIGLYRDEETLQPVEYYVKLPQDVADRDVILLDPMLATGNSTAHAVKLVKDAGASSVRLISIIAAPEGIANIQTAHPDVQIVVAAIDRAAERARLHRPRSRRRGRPALRHEVGFDDGLERAHRPPRGPLGRACRARDRPAADTGRRPRGAATCASSTGRTKATAQRPTIPRLGGLALFLGILVPSLAFLPLGGELRGVLLGAAVATIVGAIDDFRGLNWWQKLGGQVLAAAIPTGFGVWVQQFTFPIVGIHDVACRGSACR